jgi:hypothetical protein
MGLEKSTGRKIFLSISQGNLVRQHENPTEGLTESRVNKRGKQVHEEMFKSLTAKITDIRAKDAPFGRVWELELQDDGETFIISWQYSSRYTNNFFRILPNIDLTQPIKFAPWSMKDKKDASKTVIGISIYQKDGKVPFAFDKDNPGDMPPLVEKKVKGQKVWDDTDQLEFFEKMLIGIKSKLSNGTSVPDKVEITQDEAPF